jgi:hypothetical protein
VFRRKKTYTDKELEKKGAEIAPMLFIQSRELAYAITERAGEQDNFSADEDYFNLLTLCTAIFYLYIDRQLFTKLGAERRDKVFDSIENSYMGMLKHNYKFSDNVLNRAGSELSATVNSLSSYAHQFFPEKDESPKGTLMWEFGKLLGGIGFSPGMWLFANEVVVESMKPIKRLLDELFK